MFQHKTFGKLIVFIILWPSSLTFYFCRWGQMPPTAKVPLSNKWWSRETRRSFWRVKWRRSPRRWPSPGPSTQPKIMPVPLRRTHRTCKFTPRITTRRRSSWGTFTNWSRRRTATIRRTRGGLCSPLPPRTMCRG